MGRGGPFRVQLWLISRYGEKAQGGENLAHSACSETRITNAEAMSALGH